MGLPRPAPTPAGRVRQPINSRETRPLGPAALTKISTGVLTLQTANAYLGGTTVSNGTLRVGVSEAIPSVGSSSVAVYSSGKIDLNGFNNTINALALRAA